MIFSRGNLINNSNNFKAYLSDDNNKLFHLEAIKRSFKQKPKYITPQDFQPVVVDYLTLCFNYSKTPTIVGLSAFARYYL